MREDRFGFPSPVECLGHLGGDGDSRVFREGRAQFLEAVRGEDFLAARSVSLKGGGGTAWRMCPFEKIPSAASRCQECGAWTRSCFPLGDLASTSADHESHGWSCGHPLPFFNASR